MGTCYLCGEENGGGLGACNSCRDSVAERRHSQIAAEASRRILERKRQMVTGALCSVAILGLVLSIRFGIVRGVLDYLDTRPRPRVVDVEPLVRTYLTSSCKSPNIGNVTTLKIVRIAPEDANLQGWPIYADFSVRCGNSTWNGSNDSSTITAVARKGSNGRLQIMDPLNAFSPELAAQMESEISTLQKKMERELSSFSVNGH